MTSDDARTVYVETSVVSYSPEICTPSELMGGPEDI